MNQAEITPEDVVFVILCFEGPDLYSLAGGLGVRITNLSSALADMGFLTHLFFIGDPGLKGEETRNNGNLILHRWCQWISKYYQYGVYEGENEKLYDYNESIPRYVTENIVKPAAANGKIVVILGEEWQTADVVCRLGDLLVPQGLRDKVVLFWNANNTFSFHRIDWKRLNRTATITTVSRYMKQIIKGMGFSPLVIPNGIPNALLYTIDVQSAMELKKALPSDLIITKVARWDPDKQWDSAVEATARLKAKGLRTILLARGGLESYGGDVLKKAYSLGLTVRDVKNNGSEMTDYFKALENNNSADVLNIQFHCPQKLLRILYNVSDAVLANSGHEPFGLVGLEAMAAEGIVFTGGTGEDYAIPFYNSIVLETADSAEIEAYILYLSEHQLKKQQIRLAAKQTAALFTWEEVIKNLLQRIQYQASRQGLLRQSKADSSMQYTADTFIGTPAG